MNMTFAHAAISGILSVVPKHSLNFMDEIDNYGFSREKSLKLKETIGFDQHRTVEGNECTSDLCLYGLEHLISNGLLNTDDIGAVIFITQTPDYFMPPTSTIIHGELGLGREVLCFDINQGCTGYLYGLLQAFMLLRIPDMKKVLLLTGDTLSRCACPNDRNVWPLIADGASVSIIEKSDNDNEIFLNIRTDGSRRDSLIIPAGAFRMPSTEQTREVKVLPDGNSRSDEHFHMNGPAVFTFTLTDVPKAVTDLFEYSSIPPEKIDYFMFHQPNRFMLKKLARKLKIPDEKMPSNIVEKFGNPSSASIPVVICHNIRDILLKETQKICMSGFGVGLSWGALIMDVGPLDFCEMLEK